jgi:hypothetical protein
MKMPITPKIERARPIRAGGMAKPPVKEKGRD